MKVIQGKNLQQHRQRQEAMGAKQGRKNTLAFSRGRVVEVGGSRAGWSSESSLFESNESRRHQRLLVRALRQEDTDTRGPLTRQRIQKLALGS